MKVYNELGVLDTVAFRFFRQTRALYWLTAIFLFMLLREWLLPLTVLTDTAELHTFYYMIGSGLILDLLIQSRSITFILKIAIALWMIHSNYFVTPLFDLMWVEEVLSRVMKDIPLALQQDWLMMSPITRNLMFYLMLVVMVSLLSFLVLEQKQGLWFVFVTEGYLAALDTFMPYEADGAIVRSLVLGFLLLAVIHFAMLEKVVSPYGRSRFLYFKSLIAPLMIISLSVGVAYAAPKKEAEWPDPVAFLTGKEGFIEVGGALKKVGYDNRDELLGGPYEPDNTVAFEAVTNERTYWRGDSKDTYTGQGWQKENSEIVDVVNLHQGWDNMLFDRVKTKPIEATLDFKGAGFSTIFYPGQLQELKDYRPNDATIRYDKEHENLETHAGTSSDNKSNPELVKMEGYSLIAEVPVVSEKKLTGAGTNYPSEIRENYLQLPRSLPARVKELTESITKDAKTPYEKVRAVETYLRSSGKYRYEMKDVPVPAKGQDFVDQFLFESFRGYCDHFSTSMAVMLRSIDIPTRWVKGFSTGTEVDSDLRKGIYTFEVKNKDAHSWVEVYFPQTGWIPFEPTTSFTSPVRVDYDLVKTEAEKLAIPAVDQNSANKKKEREEKEEENVATTGRGSFVFSWKWGAPVLFLLGIGLVIAWRKQNIFIAWWLTRKISIYQGNRFPEKFEVLLLLFQRLLIPRKKGDTLREYVKKLRISGDTRQDLRYLTELYERVCYGNKEIEDKAKENAHKMMERISRQMKP